MGADETTVDPRSLYRLDGKTLGPGGYADVRRAWHRGSKEEVALKRPLPVPQAKERIRREIEAQTSLHHPNIMPIRDHDPGYEWYTMPIADGSLTKLRGELDEENLVSILLNLAEALEIAHKRKLVHRDIAPGNILALPESGTVKRRWVVADWGMVTRPYSPNSSPLTRTNQEIGTDGYAAPELSENPREATPAADVYSLGRVAAWFLTGQRPKAGRPLLPDGTYLHWRPFIWECTQEEIARRVKDMPALRKLLARVPESRDEPVEARAEKITEDILLGKTTEIETLVTLAMAYPNSHAIFFDNLAPLTSSLVAEWTRKNPDRASELAITMARHLSESPWEDRDRDYMGTPLSFIHTILRTLISAKQIGLAQDAAPSFFAADAHCGYLEQTRRTTEWLDELEGQAERAISRALTGSGSTVLAYYGALGWTPRSAILATLINP
ncbi:serine/threonine-protein kinase [Streptomyces griseiscabiei]|uniref:non-specific serine/threonine protein kinase n=1 Tax=Streptomyces griseiscabiei TaxID=2993540 RepID=A0ABU4LGN9_9ACTN|nr:serine/threonine-protein kinase [Streptomyces griseiscabiei]MBZ3908202.1 serine/threonine protein kinase [Streptomyces griseiscabiei]MDX2914954.1 serine/threonine-protein kinase [Streptomyces griseiscabiei]